MRQVDLRSKNATTAREYRGSVPRASFDVGEALEVVRPICHAVRDRGDEAVLDFCEKFDKVRPASLRVPQSALDAALDGLDGAVKAALGESIRRLRATCERELESSVVTVVADGATVERKMVPIERVGLYVPGGLAPLVSTVVMNVVPAQVAGVTEIALTSPPQAEFGGLPHPTILAACALLGVDEVYAAGGAQSLAMLAYGTQSCPSVDLITGPGNIYVAAAKRFLQGLVSIDAEAGPTEIAIIADGTANPDFLAADLISQAEHDPLAASVLISADESLFDHVRESLSRLVPETRHTERIRASLTGEQSAFVLVRDLDQAIDVANAYAAEHLEIHTSDSEAVAGRIINAGAIFVGQYAPVSLGDYAAGSNHVLPTAGCACHSSGLSVRAFTKNMQIVNYTAAALGEVGPHVVTLAEAENLPSHGAAVSIRLEAIQ